MNHFDATAALGRVALDMAGLRQQAIAHNIANAGTPGFAPVRLRFDAQLDALRQAAVQGRDDDLRQVAAAPRPEISTSSEPVSLDGEMTELSANSLQYQTVAKLLRRHFDLLSLAVTEGRK